MSKIYYKKKSHLSLRSYIRYLSIILCLGGLSIFTYVILPFISWQIYFAPEFNYQGIKSPIPRETIITSHIGVDLLNQTKNNFTTNYSDIHNWFPGINIKNENKKLPSINSYSLSIPKLEIKNAYVSTMDNDIDSHLINYNGTAIPPNKGTAVIFGHSTLPQLFNMRDYKTIFAKLYTIKNGDIIETNINGVVYTYSVYSITVTDPLDTSVFLQQYDGKYLTIVTCTPPGTTWKRLIVKSRINKSL